MVFPPTTRPMPSSTCGLRIRPRAPGPRVSMTRSGFSATRKFALKSVNVNARNCPGCPGTVTTVHIVPSRPTPTEPTGALSEMKSALGFGTSRSGAPPRATPFASLNVVVLASSRVSRSAVGAAVTPVGLAPASFATPRMALPPAAAWAGVAATAPATTAPAAPAATTPAPLSTRRRFTFCSVVHCRSSR